MIYNGFRDSSMVLFGCNLDLHDSFSPQLIENRAI